MTRQFAEEQKAFALRQAESGVPVPVPEILWKLGISEATFYRWKKKYGGLIVPLMLTIYSGTPPSPSAGENSTDLASEK